jgi:heat shock protein HslJ
MSFQDGTVSITGGCNILNGAYTVEGDTLTAGPFAMTQMACDQPLMDQDTWIAGVMEAGVTVAVDGSTATLTGSDVTITLTDRASLPATPLEGTRWELESVITNDAATSFGAMASLTITEGTAAVETGCNTGSGGVEATDTSLTWGAIALTLKACEGPGADLEAIVVQVLQGETPYVIDVDQLSITSTDGATTLVYRAAA